MEQHGFAARANTTNPPVTHLSGAVIVLAVIILAVIMVNVIIQPVNHLSEAVAVIINCCCHISYATYTHTDMQKAHALTLKNYCGPTMRTRTEEKEDFEHLEDYEEEL